MLIKCSYCPEYVERKNNQKKATCFSCKIYYQKLQNAKMSELYEKEKTN